MKRLALFLATILTLLASAAQAAFYQWVDGDGVVHFTDSRKKIPPKYRSKAKELKRLGPSKPTTSSPSTAGSAPAAKGPAPAQAAPSAAARPDRFLPGGHDEAWWRERYASLRRELQLAREALVPKQAKLAEARRKRAIYTRIRDREAVNALEAEVAADELRVSELLRQLDVLEQDATRAGVPFEWRQ